MYYVGLIYVCGVLLGNDCKGQGIVSSIYFDAGGVETRLTCKLTQIRLRMVYNKRVPDGLNVGCQKDLKLIGKFECGLSFQMIQRIRKHRLVLPLYFIFVVEALNVILAPPFNYQNYHSPDKLGPRSNATK